MNDEVEFYFRTNTDFLNDDFYAIDGLIDLIMSRFGMNQRIFSMILMRSLFINKKAINLLI